MKRAIVQVTSFLVVLLSLASLVSCFAQSNAGARKNNGSGQGFGKQPPTNVKTKNAADLNPTADSEQKYLEPFGLEFSHENDYRSVRTKIDRPAGEVFLEIPLKDTLTVDSIRSKLTSCSSDNEPEDQEEALALGLLRLKSEDPYISGVLPKTHQNVWTMPGEYWNLWKAALPRCYLETFAATRQRVSKFATQIAETNEFSLEDVLWAFSMVRSRSLAVPELAKDDSNIPLALIPGLDLLNHEFGSTTQLTLDEQSQKWLLASSDAIAAGTEVYLSYGDDKDNWKLLLTYGFSLPSNPNAVAFWSWRDLLDAAKVVRPTTFSERVCQQLMRHPQLEVYTTISEHRATFSYDAASKTPRESLANGFVLLNSLAAQLGSPEPDNGAVLSNEVLGELIKKRLQELRDGQSILKEAKDIDSEWEPFFESLRVALQAEEKQLEA